jgi:hypothetical protein
VIFLLRDLTLCLHYLGSLHIIRHTATLLTFATKYFSVKRKSFWAHLWASKANAFLSRRYNADKQLEIFERNAIMPADATRSEEFSFACTTFPNNEKTRTLFQFYNNGNKDIKGGGKRTYYKCKNPKCEVKFTHTKVDSNRSPTESRTFSTEPNNHPPPPNPPIDSEVKERSLSHLRVGASPANVHK